MLQGISDRRIEKFTELEREDRKITVITEIAIFNTHITYDIN